MFKKILSVLFCVILLGSCFILPATTASAADVPLANRVVGYLPTWSTGYFNRIDYSALTHLNIAFMTYNNGTMTTGLSASQINSIVTNCHNNDVKCLIAFGGGGGFTYNSNPLSTASSRTTIINNLMNFVNTYNLDGVDIDIEITDSNVWSYFETFISELSARLKANNKLLTMAVSSWFTGPITNRTYTYFDFINIMAYDYAAGNGPVAPWECVYDLVGHYAAKGISNDRLVIGVPFYGYTVSGGWNGYTAYRDILANNAANRTDSDDYSNSFGGIYFNSETTIRAKAEYSKNYGGIMIWELSQDNFGEYSLLAAIKEVMSEGATSNPFTGDNLALNKNVTVSGTESNASYDLSAVNAVDGNTSTRWSSEHVDPSYITVDLGDTYAISGVRLNWEAAYATSYRIDVSTDGTNFNTVYTDNAGNGGIDNIELDYAEVRYVKMYGTARATQYGYSLYEFEVYGDKPISVPSTFNSTQYTAKSSEIANNGNHVGNLVDGSYLDYLIDVPESGKYTISLMAAAGNANKERTISVYSGNTLLTTLPVYNSNDWFNYSELRNGLALNAGVQTIRLSTDGSVNIENITIAKASVYEIPCTVAAPAYASVEGTTYILDNAVTSMDHEEKTFYIVNVPETGEYKVKVTTAATADTRLHIDTNLSGSYVWVNTLAIASTGSLNTYAETEATINLTAGVQTLKFVAQDSLNFKGFSIERATPEVVTVPDAYVFMVGNVNAYWVTYDYSFTTNVACQFVDGVTYVPFRDIANAAGAKSISFNAAGTVTIVNGYDMTFNLTMNSTACTVTYGGNTQSSALNSAPQFIDGVCCLPIRDVSNITFASVQFVETADEGYVLVSANVLSNAEIEQCIDLFAAK